MKSMKRAGLALLLAMPLLVPQAASAKLPIFRAETAAKQYVKNNCSASYCTVARCRRLSASRVDCTGSEWHIYPVNEKCFFTVHTQRLGSFGRPTVWSGPKSCE
jgi:hypothetical protein